MPFTLAPQARLGGCPCTTACLPGKYARNLYGRSRAVEYASDQCIGNLLRQHVHRCVALWCPAVFAAPDVLARTTARRAVPGGILVAPATLAQLTPAFVTVTHVGSCS
jgi:hypothetical protein